MNKYNYSKSGLKQSLPLNQRKLDIDIELLFDIREIQFLAPYIPVLNDMIEEVEATLKAIEDSM